MDIQPLGQRNLLIYLNGDEMGALPLPPRDMKTDEAAELLKAALGDRCAGLWDNVYLELYAGKESLLLFARAHSGDPYFFTFDDIENLIEAARLCPDDVIAYLTYCSGKYYLVVYPWDKETPPGALYEYGEPVTPHPYYALYLTEHGKTLLGPTALDELKRLF